jgi:hypothetical protein
VDSGDRASIFGNSTKASRDCEAVDLAENPGGEGLPGRTLEVAAQFDEGSGLEAGLGTTKVIGRDGAEGRRGRRGETWILACGDVAQQSAGFTAGGLGCPGRSVTADCDEALSASYAVLENVDGIAALATDPKAPDSCVPDRTARL